MSTDPYRTPGDEPDRSADDHPTVEIPRDTTDTSAEVPREPGLSAAGSPATGSPASGSPIADGPVAAGSSGAPVEAPAPGRTRPRTGTVVWGVVVLVVAVGLLARTAGARIDTELAAILLLATAGLLLVVGSVVGALRRRRGDGS